MSDKKRYLVCDLAREAGLSPNTVRMIADRDLIECRRDYNNWRIFDESAIEKLKEIAGIKKKPATVDAAQIGI